jgi:membrane fusion protein, multidrug efflux system
VADENQEPVGATDHGHPSAPESARRGRGRSREALVLASGTVALAVLGVILVLRADRRVNKVALGGAPRPVTVELSVPTEYREARTYVGSVEAWIEASVGPQYVSAYVETVPVRPGDVVTRGQVLATLDCSNPSASTRAMEMQVRASRARLQAITDQADRERSLLDGGFIAPNQVEQTTAQSSAESAHLLETRARLLGSSLEVHDCVLKAPFDGEVATRTMDPGAFARPGAAIVSIVDRNTVRVTVDTPEKDFDIVPVGTPVRVRMLSTRNDVEGKVSRRAPRADPRTRTIHIEMDLPDPRRAFPTGTTALVQVDVGNPVPATKIPLYAATQHERKARLFVVEDGVARVHEIAVLGERGGDLYFDPKHLPANASIVTEGRALLSDGEAVRTKAEPARTPEQPDGGARGGGFGRPL